MKQILMVLVFLLTVSCVFAITQDEAIQIAQDHSNTTQIPLEVELEEGVYDIEVQVGDIMYEFEIDNVTGEILQVEEEMINQSQDVAITQEQAEDIALSEFGEGATIIEIELDDGFYEVDIVVDGIESEVIIDAQTQTIVSVTAEDQEEIYDPVLISESDVYQLIYKQYGNVSILEIKQDDSEYEVVAEIGSQTVEIKIDATVGEVTSFEEEDEMSPPKQLEAMPVEKVLERRSLVLARVLLFQLDKVIAQGEMIEELTNTSIPQLQELSDLRSTVNSELVTPQMVGSVTSSAKQLVNEIRQSVELTGEQRAEVRQRVNEAPTYREQKQEIDAVREQFNQRKRLKVENDRIESETRSDNARSKIRIEDDKSESESEEDGVKQRLKVEDDRVEYEYENETTRVKVRVDSDGETRTEVRVRDDDDREDELEDAEDELEDAEDELEDAEDEEDDDDE